MKVAITGAAGLFGHGLVQVFKGSCRTYPLTRADADITKADEVQRVLTALKPDVVIHSAAIPDLDISEADPAKATLVNVQGTQHVVDAAKEIRAAVAYISTDAVFDGNQQVPYTESDQTNPPSVYGRTKLRGEQIVGSLPNHWIFRVSVLFGLGKTNFIEKGLHKILAGEEYVVAADQIGSATYTLDAAEKIIEVLKVRQYGLFHLSNFGPCSRLELARHAADLVGLNSSKVIGKPADEMGRRAPRLKYAVMQMRALQEAGFALPRSWQDALAVYIQSLDFPRQSVSGTGTPP
jgi:dTDP-4-dehydrorhamnose reductase